MTCIDDTENDAADLITGLRENFAPEILYGKEAMTGETVIKLCLKEYLTENGVPYETRPDNACEIWGLVNQMYSNKTEREMGYGLLRGRAEGHEEEAIVHGGQASTVQAELSTRARITTAMTSTFKQNDDKFEGKLEDSL